MPDQIKSDFIKHYTQRKYQEFEPVSLLSKAFPTNFTPSGGEEHLNDILQEDNPKISFCTVQRCFRYQDIERMSTGYHLPLFDMAVAISVNEYSLEESIKQFLDLFDSYGLERSKIRISIFAGDTVFGKEIPRDELALAIWRKQGFQEDQFVFLDKTENYFALKSQGYDGLKTEIFYKHNDDWVELAVFIRLLHTLKLENTGEVILYNMKHNVIGNGFGIKRMDMLLRKKNNIIEVESSITHRNIDLTNPKELAELKLEQSFSILWEIFLDGFPLAKSNQFKGRGRSNLVLKIIRQANICLNSINDHELSQSILEDIVSQSQVPLDKVNNFNFFIYEKFPSISRSTSFTKQIK